MSTTIKTIRDLIILEGSLVLNLEEAKELRDQLDDAIDEMHLKREKGEG